MKKYQARKDLVWEEIDGEVVILDHEKGKTWRLNQTALVVWMSLMSGPKTEKDLVEILKNKFEVDSDQVMSDVRDVLKVLKTNKLV